MLSLSRRAGGVRRHPVFLLFAVLLFAAGCAGGPPSGGPVPFASDDAPYPAAKDLRSAEGVISAAHPLASQAGAQMLARGGNAVDAAVAAAFVLSVVEPTMSGLGGRAQILIRLPDGRHVGIDGTTQAPATYDPDTAPQASYGYATVGVPGVPAALLRALEEYGTLDRETVMAPAIRIATEGFEVLPLEAERLASALERIREFEGTSAAFLNAAGTTFVAGERWTQPDLAGVLRAIAEGGHDAFYRGPIAERMAADIQAHGGAVTMESLAAYEAVDTEIVTGSYRGHDLVGMWVPSYGAITIEVLHLLETLDVAAMDEAEWALAVAEAIRVGYLDRSEQGTAADAARLTSKAWARERAERMRIGAGVGVGGGPDGAAGAAPWEAEWQAPREMPWEPLWEAVPDGHTTHLTTADRDGMVVSLTQSIGPTMGSVVATPGLGFLYAATLGGYLGRMEPGERARSHISPFMVESDGEPFLAMGGAGGSRIPTAIVAVVSRVIDHGLGLPEALQAPRVVPAAFGESTPLAVSLEVSTGMGFDAPALAALRAMGVEVGEVARAGAFGRIHAVRWHPETGEWEGAADPDWEGVAAAPEGR